MYTSEEVIYAASALAPYLPNGLQEHLSGLLGRAQMGETVDNLIIDLLRDDEAARSWMHLALQSKDNGGMQRRYETLAGMPASIPANSCWVCQVCGFEWRVLRAGRPVPPCPKDHSLLKRLDTYSGKEGGTGDVG